MVRLGVRNLVQFGAFALVAVTLLGCFDSDPSGGGDKPASPFNCESDLVVDNLHKVENKGLCVDDTSFFDCPEKLLQNWPHTEQAVRHVRLFKAFRPEDSEEQTTRTRNNFVNYVHANNIVVLVGSQITCSEEEDDEDWGNVQKLIEALGPEHVSALAVGNELDRLMYKDKKHVPEGCLVKIFDEGYLLSRTLSRIQWAREALGNPELRVTSVFTAGITWGEGVNSEVGQFDEQEGSKVNSYFEAVYKSGEQNFIFVINYYPIFDPNSHPNNCASAIQRSVCTDKMGQGDCALTTVQLPHTRTMMNRFFANHPEFGFTTAPLWIGEIGWSTPSLPGHAMEACEEFFSAKTFHDYYKNFLQWDLDFSDDLEPPEMAFYFTMRDATQFGNTEHFGLVEGCGATSCKLNQSNIRWPLTPQDSTQAPPLLV